MTKTAAGGMAARLRVCVPTSHTASGWGVNATPMAYGWVTVMASAGAVRAYSTWMPGADATRVSGLIGPARSDVGFCLGMACLLVAPIAGPASNHEAPKTHCLGHCIGSISGVELGVRVVCSGIGSSESYDSTQPVAASHCFQLPNWPGSGQ